MTHFTVKKKKRWCLFRLHVRTELGGEGTEGYRVLRTNYGLGTPLTYQLAHLCPRPRIPWNSLCSSFGDQDTARGRASDTGSWCALTHHALVLGKTCRYQGACGPIGATAREDPQGLPTTFPSNPERLCRQHLGEHTQ